MEKVVDALELQPDPTVWGHVKALLSSEALLSYAGVLIKIAVVILVILLVRRLVCKMIDQLFQNKLTMGLVQVSDTLEEKRLHTLAKMFKSIFSYVLYFIGIITCLDMVGFSVTTIVAGAGIVSLAVAFGAQSIVQDLMSGVFIVLENQYAVGEMVKIDAYMGTVMEIGMKTTKILTADGQLMVISNGQITKVVNYSRAAQRGNADVGIAYEENLEHVFAVMQEACEQVRLLYETNFDEAPHVMGVMSLADSSVVVRCTFTAYHWQHFMIERELRKQLKETLTAAGIEISYPKVQLVGKEELLCP